MDIDTENNNDLAGREPYVIFWRTDNLDYLRMVSKYNALSVADIANIIVGQYRLAHPLETIEIDK